MESSSLIPRDSPQPKHSLNRAIRKTFDYQPADMSCNIAQLREEQESKLCNPQVIEIRTKIWGSFSALIYVLTVRDGSIEILISV